MRKCVLQLPLPLCFVAACRKDTTLAVTCYSCRLTGNYTRQFHDIAGCNGCLPYVDSVYNGAFTVDTLVGDSLLITRLYDNYTWRFEANDSDYYYRHFNLNSTESFTFRYPDSLFFFYNIGDSGEYSRQEFTGTKQ